MHRIIENIYMRHQNIQNNQLSLSMVPIGQCNNWQYTTFKPGKQVAWSRTGLDLGSIWQLNFTVYVKGVHETTEYISDVSWGSGERGASNGRQNYTSKWSDSLLFTFKTLKPKAIRVLKCLIKYVSTRALFSLRCSKHLQRTHTLSYTYTIAHFRIRQGFWGFNNIHFTKVRKKEGAWLFPSFWYHIAMATKVCNRFVKVNSNIRASNLRKSYSTWNLIPFGSTTF